MAIPPNETLRDLEALIGAEASREIVGVFLEDFPLSMGRLRTGPSTDHMRIAHGLRSSALHMGATRLSGTLEALEDRLRRPGQAATPAEIEQVEAEFESFAAPLRAYASGRQASS